MTRVKIFSKIGLIYILWSSYIWPPSTAVTPFMRPHFGEHSLLMHLINPITRGHPSYVVRFPIPWNGHIRGEPLQFFFFFIAEFRIDTGGWPPCMLNGYISGSRQGTLTSNISNKSQIYCLSDEIMYIF